MRVFVKTCLLVGIFTGLNLSQSVALAASGSGIALTTGVVYPSNNGAIATNPGRLIQGKNSFEGLVAPAEDPIAFEASYAGNSKSVGFGIQYDNLASQSIAGASLGFGGPKLGLGVNANYNLDSESFGLNVGLAIGGMQGFGAGVLVTDLTNGLGFIIGGIGYRSKDFRIEADLEYNTDTEALVANPGLAFDFGGGKFSLMAGYSFQLSPSGGDGTLRAGAAFWLSNKFALEYLYKGNLGDHTGGIILSF